MVQVEHSPQWFDTHIVRSSDNHRDAFFPQNNGIFLFIFSKFPFITKLTYQAKNKAYFSLKFSTFVSYIATSKHDMLYIIYFLLRAFLVGFSSVRINLITIDYIYNKIYFKPCHTHTHKWSKDHHREPK